MNGPRPLEPKEIDVLLVPPGRAYTLLTDHLITGKVKLLKSEPAQQQWSQIKPSIHIGPFGLLWWLFFKHILRVMTP